MNKKHLLIVALIATTLALTSIINNSNHTKLETELLNTAPLNN